MKQGCEKDINRVWASLKEGDTFRTPDNLKGAFFAISLIETDKVWIDPQRIFINRNAFIAALYYLMRKQNYVNNQCEIRSNNNSKNAGPLCQASRNENNNVRCINYIIPILKTKSIVDYSGERPNKVWLI